jgi:hypothetical protein
MFSRGPLVPPLMKPIAPLLSAMIMCAVGSACGSPTRPASTTYAGQWSGTTAQGSPVAFAITADDVVTSISVGHAFNGCSGSETFSNLNISINPTVVCVPGPCSAALSSYRAFGFGSGNPFLDTSLDINGVLLSTVQAQGSVNFRNYPGCGTVVGVSWSATKQ